MLYTYCKELGEKEPKNIEMTYTIGHYGEKFIRTKVGLRGRGIQKWGDHLYRVTEKAFEKLQSQYDIKMANYLD